MKLYVLKVTDPRHPGRVGWIGWNHRMEGASPAGVRPFTTTQAALVIKDALEHRFPRAEITLVGV